ncbi:c6 zinc finger domain-containing [Pyrenophora seminiperda CCB06]|uniref:C6 zinc finger domain-containing n=1 Tax=Pyrenophora seminiperda CCB06 TaxID=1302712 RepID=A0A3M7MBT6_9PLEO|nr:c6 zinc finger domain-containing [Pyrenophora seminiperda CCB06]
MSYIIESNPRRGTLRSSDEEMNRSRTPRVPPACKVCRQHMQRYDGSFPCKTCTERGKACYYERIPFTDRERGIREITRTTETRFRELRALSIHLKEPSTSPRERVSPGPLQRGSLDITPENRKELFSFQKLQELCDSYMENVHIMHPIFDRPRKMFEDFITEYSNDAWVRMDSITPCTRNAIVLLFFALGSSKFISEGLYRCSGTPGMAYYSLARSILARKCQDHSTSLAQAMTLAALYTNQIGMLPESWVDVSHAYRMYTNLGEDPSQNMPISEEAKRGFWICQELAQSASSSSSGGTNASLNFVSAGFVPISRSNMLPTESPGECPVMVYETRVLLRTLLDSIRKLTPTQLFQTTRITQEDLQYLTNAATTQTRLLENWRSVLPSRLTWEDGEPPSTDPLIASLRAEYYNGLTKLLRPYLGIVRNCDTTALDKLSVCQQGFIKVVLTWVQSALSNLIVYDRIGADPNSEYEAYRSTSKIPVMLASPINTLHAEFETVLILQAIHSSAIYMLLAELTPLSETVLDTLYFRTVERLGGFRPSSQLFDRDLEILRRLRTQEDKVAFLDLGGVLAGMGIP